MVSRNVLHEDSLVSVPYAPGYRDIGIKLELNDGTSRKKQIEIRLSAEDSAHLLNQLLNAHKMAWDGANHRGPLDIRPGEQRPAYLPKD